MPQLKDNFFEGILFRFESCSCDCVMDVKHIAPGAEPNYEYKVQALPEKKLLFAYAAKKGLVRIAPNGSIEEENILGDLLSLPDKSFKDVVSFLNKNGFLFPVSTDYYEGFEAAQFFGTINRLRTVVELMTAANEIEKDYQKIADLTLQLLFAGDITIQTGSMEKPYVARHHAYMDLLASAPGLSYERQQEAFDSDYYSVQDTIFGTYQLNIQEYNDIISGSSDVPGFDDPAFRQITAMYVNYSGEGMTRQITDFLFHYFHDVGVVCFENGISYYSKPNPQAFTDGMKSSLVTIANYLIGDEINANLGGIHPIYNSETMSPSWKVDNLLCAAYFSIFYMKPDLELYRQCANPNCNRYFLVKTTSTRKKYCSTECCNCVTQTRYRKKRREAAAP